MSYGGESDESPSEYLSRLRRDFHAGLSGRKRIYMDTKFWIGLRDQTTPESKRLFERLKMLVSDRKALVVASDILLFELARQNDEKSKEKTVQMVDLLTQGYCILPMFERRNLENRDFARRTLGAAKIAESEYCTRVGLIVSSFEHIFREFPPLAAKNKIDELWEATLSAMLSDLRDKTGKELAIDLPADVLHDVNELKLHQSGSPSNRRVREFVKILKLGLPEIFSEALASEKFGSDPNAASEWVAALVCDAVKRQQSGDVEGLPAHGVILSGLYVSNEVQVQRPYKWQDYWDWEHAACALPYCDYFFTEKDMGHKIRNELRFDIINPARNKLAF